MTVTRGKWLSLVAASVVLTLAVAGTATAEKTVQEWWDNEYGVGSFAAAGGPDTKTLGYAWDSTEARAMWAGFETSHPGYWKNHLHGPVKMVLAEAGWAKQNTFGWVAYNPGTGSEEGPHFPIFEGAPVGTHTTVTIGPVDYFAFYLRNANNQTYYSVKGLNTGAGWADGYQAAWVFDDPQPLNPAFHVNHIVCWEDQAPYNYSTDHDRNDMIVKMSLTPEPAAFVLLALGGLPILYLRRRKKA